MMSSHDKFQGRVEDGVKRPCDSPDCENAGAFRAPRPPNGNDSGNGKSPAWKQEGALDERIDDSKWFCLEHVREYNADWDFFDGMSEDEINAFRDDDASWHRPTWSAADPGQAPDQGHDQGKGKAYEPGRPWTGTEDFEDPYGLFSGARGVSGAARGFNRPLDLADLKALNVLELEEGATTTEIKTSFKRLAKQHHPDLNNGDAGSEKRLRAVIEAYNRLSGAFADC